MGLLDGGIASAIYKGFKGKLLKGTLRREQPVGSAGLDSLGDPLATDPLTWACQGFTEDYSDFYRAQAGIPAGDVRVNVFAASLPRGIRPQKDDQVAFVRAGVTTWFQLRKNGTDPAEALWASPGFQIADPTA